MVIKKVNLISEEDLKDLVNILNLNIAALNGGRVELAIESLTKLKENIEKGLEDELSKL